MGAKGVPWNPPVRGTSSLSTDDSLLTLKKRVVKLSLSYIRPTPLMARKGLPGRMYFFPSGPEEPLYGSHMEREVNPPKGERIRFRKKALLGKKNSFLRKSPGGSCSRRSQKDLAEEEWAMRIWMAVWLFSLAAGLLLCGGCRGRLFRDRDEEILYCYPIQCQPAQTSTLVCPPGTVYAPYAPSPASQSSGMICCPP